MSTNYKKLMRFKRTNSTAGGSGSSLNVMQTLNAMGNLTFFKEYLTSTDASLRADFSTGSPTSTFTASRGASNPATIIDGAGLVTTVTTSNTPRFVGGYYDETGFHAQKGLLCEDATTNRLIQSNLFSDAAWTATTITVTNADAGSTSPDGVATASSLNATGANATLVQPFVDAVAGVWTASVWMKRKTGTGTINLRANVLDSYTAVTLTSSWCKFQVQSSSLTNPAFDLQITTSADEVYIYGSQLEKLMFATSYVPTTTVALTRNLQVYSYPATTNRTSAAETIFFRLAFNKTSTTAQPGRSLSDTEAPRRLFSKVGGGSNDTVSLYPNFTDSVAATITGTTVPQANTIYTFSGAVNRVSPYITVHNNGVFENSYTAANWIDNGVAANFYVGSAQAGFNSFEGTLVSVVIFGRVLSSAEILTVHNILSLIV